MDQIKKLAATLSLWQRIAVLAAAILVPAGIAGLVRWHHEQSFRPLFTGMSAEDAAAVVQKIKESGSEYRLGDNGTSVLAPEGCVDELRLQLAAAGLPKSGRVGFELFDKTNLGITDFTEHVNYRRALEGELERTIRAISQIQQARVHITFAKDSVFLESREPAKASVLVDVRPGSALTSRNVAAIANLVASAVEGLAPTAVSIVDMRGNLLNRPRQGTLDDGQMSDAALDYKHQVERDLAAKVESTLEPLLGPGKFRVGVSVDCDFSTTEQSEEVYDPTRSVMVNSQVSEDSSGAIQTAGIPGTQANSARPAAKPVQTPSGLSRRTENVAYDTTRTVRHVKVPQGAIKRISASVLLDDLVQWQGSGKKRKRVLVPVPPDQMNAIHDLVSGALGLVKDRDQLVLESLPFEQTITGGVDEMAGLPAPAPPQSLFSDRRVYIGAGAAIAILLGLTAVLLLKRRRNQIAFEPAPRALASAAAVETVPAVDQAPPQVLQQPLAINHQLPPVAKKVEVVRDHLRESVKSDPAFAANVLRGWLEDDAMKLRERSA